MTPLTLKMLTVLRDILEGRGTHHGCHGLRLHGERIRIINSLVKLRFIDNRHHITDAGLALAESLTQRVGEGTCQFCKREIGDGREASCVYYIAKGQP